jgi:CRP/FNR family transcriptional regulator, cyclic AMP receptor protein
MLAEKTQEVIDSNLLIVWGGVFKNYEKGDFIFHEGTHAHFYHQVIEGRVKMVSESETGKEFIQGFFSDGQSFGEPPIFEGCEYPASAIAQQPSVIIRLNVPSFIQLLKENFDVHWTITRLLAHRLFNKTLVLKEISCCGPEDRILSILKNYKKHKLNRETSIERIKIDYTRQQIADMSGLRVETVIRAMRHLNEKEILTIKGGKVFY